VKRTRLVSAFLLAALLAALLPASVSAGTLSITTWSLSDTTPGATANHTFSGTLATTNQAIRSIVVVFSQGFTIGSVVPADVTVSIGGAPQTVSTVTVNGQQLTITLSTQVTPANNTFQIQIQNNKITNPGTAGTYTASLATRRSNGNVIDTGSITTGIGQLTVTLQAVVPNSLIFTLVNDALSVMVDPSVGVQSIEMLGQVVVKTNARNGFTVQVSLNQPLTGTTSGATLQPITSGPGTLSSWDTNLVKNRWGITRRITNAANSCGTPNNVGTYGTDWAGLSTAAATFLSCTAPTNQTTLDVTFQVAVDFLQPADTYTATITYTATGSF